LSFITVSCLFLCLYFSLSFSLTDTPSTEIYTLSLHDALPISETVYRYLVNVTRPYFTKEIPDYTYSETFELKDFYVRKYAQKDRSEEHTSELQSRFDLVCRLLLEKKNKPAIS